jgi:hypothetical protein
MDKKRGGGGGELKTTPRQELLKYKPRFQFKTQN